MDAFIAKERRIKLVQVSADVGISYKSTQTILHDNLEYRKVYSLYVPKQFTEQRKQQCVDIAIKVPPTLEPWIES